MKKINLMILLVCSTLFATAQSTNWKIDHAHSRIQFSVEHMVISHITGKFKIFKGTLLSGKKDFSDLKVVNFTIDVNSIDTDNSTRDKNLRSNEFFDVTKYPSIIFNSTSIVTKDSTNYLLKGNLTMHGVTKEVTFNLKYNGTVKDPWGNTRTGFTATSSLNRKDYNLNYNAALGAGEAMVGNTVTISCSFEVIKK